MKFSGLCVVSALLAAACTPSTSDLNFEFDLETCYDPSGPDVQSSNTIQGTLTITNNGTSTVTYEIPNQPGWHVVDTTNNVVVSDVPGANVPTGPECVGCGGPHPLTIAPGQAATWSIVDLGWRFDDSTTTALVNAGTYDVSVRLNGADETNAATITLCAFSNGVGRYAECNAPCATGAPSTSCAPTLTCGPY